MFVKTFICLLVAGLIAAPAALAQSVEECRVVTVRVEALLDAMEQENSSGIEHVNQMLELAENEAAKGDGPKCMEIARRAEDAARN